MICYNCYALFIYIWYLLYYVILYIVFAFYFFSKTQLIRPAPCVCIQPRPLRAIVCVCRYYYVIVIYIDDNIYRYHLSYFFSTILNRTSHAIRSSPCVCVCNPFQPCRVFLFDRFYYILYIDFITSFIYIFIFYSLSAPISCYNLVI